ncbi:extracellular solute-binding protein, partial [Motilibacter deserti]
MSINRRQFLGLAGYSAAGIALAGCGGFGGGSEDSSNSDELTFMFWAGDAELKAFQSLAADFEKAEGVPVRLQQVPFAQLLTNVDAGLQSGQAPDVFRVTYTDLGVYSSR